MTNLNNFFQVSENRKGLHNAEIDKPDITTTLTYLTIYWINFYPKDRTTSTLRWQMEKEIKEVLGNFFSILYECWDSPFIKMKGSIPPWQIFYSVSGSAFLSVIWYL